MGREREVLTLTSHSMKSDIFPHEFSPQCFQKANLLSSADILSAHSLYENCKSGKRKLLFVQELLRWMNGFMSLVPENDKPEAHSVQHFNQTSQIGETQENHGESL